MLLEILCLKFTVWTSCGDSWELLNRASRWSLKNISTSLTKLLEDFLQKLAKTFLWISPAHKSSRLDFGLTTSKAFGSFLWGLRCEVYTVKFTVWSLIGCEDRLTEPLGDPYLVLYLALNASLDLVKTRNRFFRFLALLFSDSLKELGNEES